MDDKDILKKEISFWICAEGYLRRNLRNLLYQVYDCKGNLVWELHIEPQGTSVYVPDEDKVSGDILCLFSRLMLGEVRYSSCVSALESVEDWHEG